MSKYHGTVTRRDFMKGLGLAGAGLGAAAAATPVFHDLDEVISSAPPGLHRPWWVKEVDEPTVEVDWAIMANGFDLTHSPSHGKHKEEWATWLGNGDYESGEALRQKHNADRSARRIQYREQKLMGHRVQDLAVKSGQGAGGSWTHSKGRIGFLGPQTASTPESLGLAKWSGTPEENSRMVTAALKHWGAPTVGLINLEPGTTRNFIYRYEAGDSIPERPYKWEDVPLGYETDTKRVLPDKCRWGFTWTFYQGHMAGEAGLSSDRYNMGRHQHYKVQEMIRALGYSAYGPYSYPNNFGCAGAFGVMGGLGEIGRNIVLTSPILQGSHGMGAKLATDLPLAPGKPVDFGMRPFCRTCMICAEQCPGDAISLDTEPTWEVNGSWDQAGIKTWRYLAGKCFPFMDMQPCNASGPAGCQKWCPFYSDDRAMLHEVVRAIVSTTSIFNGFFTNMESTFGYEPRTFEEWWQADLPPYGVDTMRVQRYS